eukprot:gnl/Chilomastix_caulleri/5034.p1 GENE.gnl/Chilomastix_caulleri/5034~~gnl/Chilomastix_caulleri/5034.p1  ORF type:complete len:143 (-),score=28.22 gnl/Chilomastix_caulleri/5034:97-525(-)
MLVDPNANRRHLNQMTVGLGSIPCLVSRSASASIQTSIEKTKGKSSTSPPSQQSQSKEGQGQKQVISFRDSKLLQLLAPCFSLYSTSFFIITIAPIEVQALDSWRALRFGNTAMNAVRRMKRSKYGETETYNKRERTRLTSL